MSEVISEVERHTDAELVTVLARQADEYYYIPTLWAAILALLAPAIAKFTPFWLDTDDVLVVQLGVFLAVALVFRIPWILRHLIPGPVKRRRASNLAKRMFLENNLHHTRNETGVLIFVSETEHYVEIIADRGINDKVAAETWDMIVGEFTTSMKQGRVQEGLVSMIEACGELLHEHVPATTEKNELPDHLILI